MHTVALSSLEAGGAGAGFLVVVAVIYPLLRLATMILSRGRMTGRGWPYPGPGSAGYGARTRPDIIGQGGAAQDYAGQRGQATAEHLRREQDQAYWEPPEEAGTLPANGFIGDAGQDVTGPQG
jgi:hypothetical protein